jgi:hypothetical protein
MLVGKNAARIHQQAVFPHAADDGKRASPQSGG